jgi:hypothetical protein
MNTADLLQAQSRLLPASGIPDPNYGHRFSTVNNENRY